MLFESARDERWESTNDRDHYVISVEFETKSSDMAKIATPDPPSDNFSHIPESRVLVFSDYVYEDGELKGSRRPVRFGRTGEIRRWFMVRFASVIGIPTVGRSTSLSSVKLAQKNGIWSLGEGFISMLAGTTHSSPAESFGGNDDSCISKIHVVYLLRWTSNCFWHGTLSRTSTSLISEVASSKHGATYSSVFSNDGAKASSLYLCTYESLFSEDDKCLHFTAGSRARHKVSVLPVPASKPGSDKKLASPFKPTDKHTTSAIQPLPGGRLLEKLNGKSLDAGEEFYFDGAEMKIQGWISKLRGYSKNNRKAFGKMDDLTDTIKEDWGGKPLVDLRRGWQYILDNYLRIDSDCAVATGGDYGGYATKYFFALIPRDRDKDVPSWIQRNPGYGFGLKALVCRDRVFDSQYGEYSTVEHYFFNHESGGQPWKDKIRELTRRFSLSSRVHKWSTPELTIHGSRGYRLPEADGIAAFHALQQQGVPSRLAIFPDENHLVLNHGNSLKRHHEVFRWLNQFAGKDNTNRK
ncbi:alpha/beta-hydrolase [Thelephora ganbajun]|uniref:Alpha/beta-hydrolase n=1 Tax=Thelephora ganbajun TaxID=370292 RepID=A0ACB6Z6Y4_THEGA|nr:alpha/beta-hydrolase [Thelephora ganbajun]